MIWTCMVTPTRGLDAACIHALEKCEELERVSRGTKWTAENPRLEDSVIMFDLVPQADPSDRAVITP